MIELGDWDLDAAQAGRMRAAVLKVAGRVCQLSNPLTMADRILAELESDLGYRRGCVVLRDTMTGALIVVAHSTIGPDRESHLRDIRRIEEVLNSGEPGVIARVIAEGKPVIVPDVFCEPAYHEGALEMRSEICVPIISAGATIGALNVESERRNAFGPADEFLLTIIAALLSAPLSRLPVSQFRRPQANG